MDGLYAIPLPYQGKIISTWALAYGKKDGQVLIFGEDSGKCIVEFELLRAQRQQRATENGDTGELDQKLKTISANHAQYYSSYFGSAPPPVDTPLGSVTRYIKAAEGVYFVEAGAQWMLSINFPHWHYLHYQKRDRYQGAYIGQTMCGDLDEAIRTCAYMFFMRELCAPALHLLLYESTVHQSIWDHINKNAFIAALWQYPDLVETHNKDLSQTVAIIKPDLNKLDFQTWLQEFIQDYLPPAETEDTDFLLLPH